MNIAIEGCLHGELEEVYTQLTKLEKQLGVKFDLLLICGDFQALRDQTDLDYLHCPQKYKAMGSFYKYYEQEKEAPVLTIFIGGNHEAVNYMRGLYFGGWAAKNIYYLGQAGSVYVRKGDTRIRITGMSGIYNHRDFLYTLKPERIPLYGGSKISAYHIKQLEMYRLELFSRVSQMKKEEPQTYGSDGGNFDIYLSHDWPKSTNFVIKTIYLDISLYGKTSELYKYKPFLEKEINEGVFGSPPAEKLMSLAKPIYWFSAHMHIKYAALFPHNQNEFTHFLALDKCLQKRSCIQVLNFERSGGAEEEEVYKDEMEKIEKKEETILEEKEEEINKEQKKQQQYLTVKDEINPKQSSPQLPQRPNKQTTFTTTPTQTVHIELDIQWLTIIKQTIELQNKGEVLYKYDEKQNLKLVNTKMMNEFIINYPIEYEKVFKLLNTNGNTNANVNTNVNTNTIINRFTEPTPPPCFNKEEEKQTEKLLDLLEINKNDFVGIIFPKGYFEYHHHDNNNKDVINDDDEVGVGIKETKELIKENMLSNDNVNEVNVEEGEEGDEIELDL